jgi:hypothetical protein
MTSQEFIRFDATVRKVLSVSHEELKRREAEWKLQRKIAKKRRAKAASDRRSK